MLPREVPHPTKNVANADKALNEMQEQLYFIVNL